MVEVLFENLGHFKAILYLGVFPKGALLAEWEDDPIGEVTLGRQYLYPLMSEAAWNVAHQPKG